MRALAKFELKLFLLTRTFKISIFIEKNKAAESSEALFFYVINTVAQTKSNYSLINLP